MDTTTIMEATEIWQRAKSVRHGNRDDRLAIDAQVLKNKVQTFCSIYPESVDDEDVWLINEVTDASMEIAKKI